MSLEMWRTSLKEGAIDCAATLRHNWKSMLAPTKRVLTEYCVLVLKMHHGKKLNVQAKNNLTMLCDLECFLGLAYLTPMMQASDYLIKFSRARIHFIGDMVAVGEIYQRDLYGQYGDPMCALTHEHIFTKCMTSQ
jgi:hypothetical protein